MSWALGFFEWYPWFKLIIWVLIAWWVGRKINPVWVFCFLAVFGTIQATLGISQFITQGDLGLQMLGESALSPLNRDVARTFVEGGRLLRAYGTFPHPNILAALIILSLLSCYYFFLKLTFSQKKFSIFNLQFPINFQLPNFQLIVIVTAIFINWLGLLFTFSRAGWLIGLITAWLITLLSYLHDREDRGVVMKLNAVIFLILILLIPVFYWAISPRLEFYDQFSIKNRLGDYQYAWQKIKEKPFLGHGLTLAMGERPIHNLYLTVAVEIGLIGLVIFLVFIIYLIIKNWKLEIENLRLERSILIIMFLGLLIFGLSDHFLWTLRPGLAMFWLVAGLLIFRSRCSRCSRS